MKRYQIFISSTYNDLKDERFAVLESILKLRHIPVGMEQFVAANEEQFNYIKRLIDETDYYILILGNRYGSTASDGISYTEKEFDYAVSKEIPILAFIHDTPESLPVNKSEKSTSAKKQLTKFRDKVEKNRLVSLFTWDNPISLSREVVVALTNAFNDFPRPGWERVISYDNAELLSQINDLRIENKKLKSKINDLASSSNLSAKINAFPWDETLCFIGRSKWDDYKDIEVPVNISWRQLLSVWGPVVINGSDTTLSHFALNYSLFGDEEPYFSVSDRDFRAMVVSFLKAGVVELEDHKLRLTNEGKNYLLENSVSTNDVFEGTMAQIKSVKNKTSKDNRVFQKYIKELASFNSNPEAINYFGETLVGISVFLSNQHTLHNDDVNRAQNLIKEILQQASEYERTDMDAFEHIFYWSKILELTTIMQKGVK